MPTYDYICVNGHSFSELVKISERNNQFCFICGGRTKLKPGAPGIKFVGPGFYKNDYKRQENLDKDFKSEKVPDANSELRKNKNN